jgi:hypothetical protein
VKPLFFEEQEDRNENEESFLTILVRSWSSLKLLREENNPKLSLEENRTLDLDKVK